VLHLEDTPLDAGLIRCTLGDEGIDCELALVRTKETFEHAITENHFDLILSDYAIPGYDGLSALAFVRKTQSGVPFIFVSGKLGEEQAVNSLKSGATDYVLKNRLNRLAPAVRRALSEAEAQIQRKQAEEAVHELSTRLLKSQDEWRRQFGRDLHDTVAQNLAIVSMSLTVAQRLAPSSDTRLHDVLAEGLDAAQKTTQQVRTIAYVLHPPTLDVAGLPNALREFAEAFSERSGIRTDVTIPDGGERLPLEIETALFHIARECLGNVHRHSGSDTASLRLERSYEAVLLEVKDAGRGMDLDRAQRLQRGLIAPGVGIASIRERLGWLGGRLEIETGTTGTLLRAIVPLKSY
jgi:signal transduction histidine kinase